MAKIKICGITTLENALEVASCNIHAIGLNFYQKSKRQIDINTAKEICEKIPPFITRVGLFVNHTRDEVQNIINKVELDILQFHGGESAEFCESFNKNYIKAIGVDENTDLNIINQYKNAKAILLDNKDVSFGGSGKSFDWSIIKQNFDKPIILAGGINENNILDAIKKVNPYAVDIASGVESGTYGIKDINKINNITNILKDV